MMQSTTTRPKSRLRWLAVLPAAVGAWAGIQLLLAFLINAPFYGDVMIGMYGTALGLLKDFVYFAAAPYWFVVTGSHFAPAHHFEVALVLAAIIAGIQLVLSTFLVISGLSPPSVSLVGLAFLLAAVALAAIQVRSGSTPLSR